MPAVKNGDSKSTNGHLPIGVVIRAWRNHRESSLNKLAQQAGISKSYLSALENNRVANPDPEYIEKIALALNVDSDIFTSGELPPGYKIAETSQLPIPELGHEVLATGILNVFREKKLSAEETSLAIEEVLTYTNIVAQMITTTRHRVQAAMQPVIEQEDLLEAK